MTTTAAQAPATTPPQNGEIQKAKESFFEKVTGDIMQLTESGGLDLPKDYSVTNALKAAWLILSETKAKDGRLALEACTKKSIIEALMKMVQQGLNPAKAQCYLLPYGDKLNFQRSYQGSIALAKRVAGLVSINAQVIYEGDEYETEIDTATGIKKLTKHIQKFENRLDSKIKGAYCIAVFEGGVSVLEEMTFTEIKAAWNQGQSNGGSPAHKNFPGEMCKKTVINRALKTPINSSTDSGLMEDDSESIGPEAELSEKIKKEGNKTPLVFDEAEEVKTEAIQAPEKPKAQQPAPSPEAAFEAEKKQPATGQQMQLEPSFA